MSSSKVKPLAEATREKLKQAIEQLELFLNRHSLPELASAHEGDGAEHFYKGLLADLRHLLVFSEVADEKLGAVIRRPNFDTDAAERILYDVYHQCVNAFFYPKNEGYSEDGRYAYTGQDAIRFLFKPTKEASGIVLGVSKIYEELRDDLAYYENDYMTQRRMSALGQK